MATQTQKPSQQKEEAQTRIIVPIKNRIRKVQKEEYLIKNACYSVTKYYLCKQNNKRSLLGRKQRSQVARSFPNRYLFSFTNKVTSLFSISCILRIILLCNWVMRISVIKLKLRSLIPVSTKACVRNGNIICIPLPTNIPMINWANWLLYGRRYFTKKAKYFVLGLCLSP